MKKFIIICFIVVTTCISAKAHRPYRYTNAFEKPIGCNIGASYYKNGSTGICCGVECMGFTFEYAFAGKYKVDSQYGNGGLSNDYRMSSYMIGHIGYLHCRHNTFITINPKVGMCVESRLYNYRYGNNDVAYNNSYLEGGLDVGVNVNRFLFLKVGASNMKLNAQVAISF